MPRRQDFSWVLMGIRRSFHTDYAILQAIYTNPQAGVFLGTDGHQKVFSHRLRHTARHTNYSMYNVPQLGYLMVMEVLKRDPCHQDSVIRQQFHLNEGDTELIWFLLSVTSSK